MRKFLKNIVETFRGKLSLAFLLLAVIIWVSMTLQGGYANRDFTGVQYAIIFGVLNLGGLLILSESFYKPPEPAPPKDPKKKETEKVEIQPLAALVLAHMLCLIFYFLSVFVF